MTHLGRLHTTIEPGDRVLHKRFRSRGTVISVSKTRMLIEFDNTDRQLLGSGSIQLLKKSDLHPEERFRVGERVQHWQTGAYGTVQAQHGDRVLVYMASDGRRELCQAKHLLHKS